MLIWQLALFGARPAERGTVCESPDAQRGQYLPVYKCPQREVACCCGWHRRLVSAHLISSRLVSSADDCFDSTRIRLWLK